jgi:hypothetical protein
VNAHDVYVSSIEDHEDGSATISFDIGIDALKVFASIGLQQVLLEKAKEIVDGHSDTKGSGDAGTGEGGNSPLSREFPGF